MKLRMIVIATLFAAACGSKSKGTGGGGGTTPTGGGGGETAAGGALAPGKWETMSHEERAEFMNKVVKPTMEPIFKGFDKDRFAQFGCKTCHGKGVDDHSFKMPNPDLPELTPDKIENPEPDDKAITEFMMTKVKPQMAQLLGMPEYSQDNPNGFGCAECHPFKM